MGISTHILDTGLGRPAADVSVSLFEFRGGEAEGSWVLIGNAATDQDGRAKTLLGDHAPAAAQYRLDFDVNSYFDRLGITSIYPCVQIVFRVADPAQHYHIPLLLTANGYTTYRGS
jgi:5-hydroxyisourate hydrolase